jgi:hypothetical protein
MIAIDEIKHDGTYALFDALLSAVVGGNKPTGGIVSGSIVDGEGVSGISPSRGVIVGAIVVVTTSSIDMMLMDKSEGSVTAATGAVVVVVVMVVLNRLTIGGAEAVSGVMDGAIVVIDIDILTPSIVITGPGPSSGPTPNPGSTSLQLA